MEGARFLLAIVLSIAVVILVNVMFPPTPGPRGAPGDSLSVDTVAMAAPPDSAPEPAAGPERQPDLAPEQDVPDRPLFATPEPAATQAVPVDTFWVRTDVARYGFSERGGALVSLELSRFSSYTREGPVQLVEPGDTALLEYALSIGDRVIPLSSFTFHASVPAGDTLVVGDSGSLTLTAEPEGSRITVRYHFSRSSYVVEAEGSVEGVAEDATLLLDLGPRLAVNEADSAEDSRALAYVYNNRRTGIQSQRIDKVTEERVEEGPLSWIALKNKYFVAAALQPEDESTPFGGLIARASPDGATAVQATHPLARDGAFRLRFFFGPQEFDRLSALGQGLKDVNPYGWHFMRPVIRPLVEIITWILTELHNVLGFGYGWVLILFGFAMRGLLWPLNAKAMRSQLKTMELQPRIKEIQEKYKDKPEQLQKEMMRLYKEEGFNPLGGCLPMLIPWPVLITLFFVFRNTIEFRGVEFLWLPDLSLPDPLYILPVVLGVSLFALQFMNIRATGSDNPQQKMMMWVMPIMMMVLFLRFASGLNLYYAASNVASLPQQIKIIGERKQAKARIDAKQQAKRE
jgi:YidC/Oxa1 family membrane protein insertase